MSFYGRYAGTTGGGGGGGGGGATAPYAGTVALGSGVSSAVVAFSVALATTPAVVCWISSSNVSANLITSMGTGISTAGFTALLGSTTPDTTYALNWIASVAND